MQIAPTCLTPGVDVPPGSQRRTNWYDAPDGGPVARFHFANLKPQLVYPNASNRGGATYAVGTDRRVDPNATNARSSDNVFHRTGTSFLDALRAAHRETLASTRGDGAPVWVATAVLRGKDGAFWITSLARAGRADAGGVVVDGPLARLPKLDRIEPLSDQLLAVVGGESWQNFSGTDVDFELPQR